MMISILLGVGLCTFIYFCNRKIQQLIKQGNVKAMLIWLYLTMISSVMITALFIYSIRGLLISLLDVFYRK